MKHKSIKKEYIKYTRDYKFLKLKSIREKLDHDLNKSKYVLKNNVKNKTQRVVQGNPDIITNKSIIKIISSKQWKYGLGYLLILSTSKEYKEHLKILILFDHENKSRDWKRLVNESCLKLGINVIYESKNSETTFTKYIKNE